MRALATSLTLAPALMSVAVAAPARAEQMVLFDISYTHTADRNAHHQVSGAMLNQPSNWTAPINYANGTIHFYQEVETKPSKLVTIVDFCFISSGGYGCIETLPYTTTGVNETERSMAPGGHWYQRDQINFATKIGSIELVLKDPATYTNGCPNKADCLPSKMRFVATLVSPGGTYQRPTPTPGFDAGAPASDGATPPTSDARSTTGPGDAPVTYPEPPPTPDAAAPDPNPTPRLDAASAPKPDATAGPTEQPPPQPPPAKRRSSSGCSYGGPGRAGLTSLLPLLALARRRRAGRASS
jgi:hypothetical protein